MFHDFLQPIELIKDEKCEPVSPPRHISKVFVNQLVENIINGDRQLKFESKILPYEERKSGLELFKCPMCELENIEGRKALTEHLHYHQIQYKPCEGKHLCCLCGKELSSNSSLERHLLTHSNHRPFDCEICGKKFTTNGNLSRHIKASHTGESANDSLSQISIKMMTNPYQSPQTSPSRTPLSSILSPNLSTITSIHDRWALPALHFPGTNDVLLRILENSLKAYKTALSNDNPDEILNLSKKSNIATETCMDTPCGNFPNVNWRDEVTVSSCKKMAMKISQKYRDRRINTSQRPHHNITEHQDLPLDLSMTKCNSPIVPEKNSFLSNSPDSAMPSLPKLETVSNINLLYKHKKNSYKDAPKLIRCPMVGCSQKFPWNSSLMRHILTHTAHKPFRCIRCTKCFSTKSNRERHMNRVHGIKVNRLLMKSTQSPESSICENKEEFELMEPMEHDGFLSEREWLEMSSSDRQAENISHTLLKQAGEPVIEPNPYRQHSQMKMLLKIA